MRIEVSPDGWSIDGAPFPVAPTPEELHALLGPARVDLPEQRLIGHRSGRRHVYPAAGLSFLEDHASFRIKAFSVHLTADERVAEPFLGALTVGGVSLSTETRGSRAPVFAGFPALRWSIGRQASTASSALQVHLDFREGTRRNPRLSKVSVSSVAEVATRSPGPHLVMRQAPDGWVEPVAAFATAEDARADADRRAVLEPACRFSVHVRAGRSR